MIINLRGFQRLDFIEKDRKESLNLNEILRSIFLEENSSPCGTIIADLRHHFQCLDESKRKKGSEKKRQKFHSFVFRNNGYVDFDKGFYWSKSYKSI